MVSVKGDIVEVTEQSHPDLLWAIRGAGQFFGLITQIDITTYPLSLLGNDGGLIWSGIFAFPLARAEEVANTMESLMNDRRYPTAGLMMVMAPPPTKMPSLVVSGRFIGDPKDAELAYKPLHDLKPVMVKGGAVPIQNLSDGREAFEAKGDFKRFGVVGLHQFDKDSFLETVSLWKQMIDECPDAISTSFNFQWDSRPVKQPQFDSALSLHDIRYWQ